MSQEQREKLRQHIQTSPNEHRKQRILKIIDEVSKEET